MSLRRRMSRITGANVSYKRLLYVIGLAAAEKLNPDDNAGYIHALCAGDSFCLSQWSATPYSLDCAHSGHVGEQYGQCKASKRTKRHLESNMNRSDANASRESITVVTLPSKTDTALSHWVLPEGWLDQEWVSSALEVRAPVDV